MQKPEEYSINKIDDTHAEVSIRITPDLFYLKGHFPVQPLLPGVVQLGWAYEFSKEIFGLESEFYGVPMLKFLLPILPDDDVILYLTFDKTRQRLEFEYNISVKGEYQKSSAGKIALKEKESA